MSNDNAIVRAFKLWAKVSMMVVDGTRDATVVADALQVILDQSTKPVFDPATFIGKGWSYDVARDSRSAALGLFDDYGRVVLSTKWLEGRSSVGGEERRSRILKDKSATPLNCDHFLDLWNNKEKIPESWKKVGVITFDGDVLRNPHGRRCVLCLYWGGGRWRWRYRWLDDGWGASRPSAVLAS